MAANDNAMTPVNLDDNINTRDQRRVGIWLVVLVALFVAFLMSLGFSHAPQDASKEIGQSEGALSPNSPPGATQSSELSVNSPVGEVEPPGQVGTPQDKLHFINGHGNTPVPSQGQSSVVGAGSTIAPGGSSGSTSTAAPH